jgi:hypothetical protein
VLLGTLQLAQREPQGPRVQLAQMGPLGQREQLVQRELVCSRRACSQQALKARGQRQWTALAQKSTREEQMREQKL